jgi:hypothetical protein
MLFYLPKYVVAPRFESEYVLKKISEKRDFSGGTICGSEVGHAAVSTWGLRHSHAIGAGSGLAALASILR